MPEKLPEEGLGKNLEAVAAEEAEKMVAAASREAEKIVEAAKKECQQQEEAQLREAAGRIESEKTGIMRSAGQKANRLVLKAKEDVLDSVFVEAGQRLAGIRKKPGYEKVMAGLAKEAIAEIECQAGWLRTDKKDETFAKKFLAEHREIRFKTRPDLECAGGVIVTSEDGRMVVDNRFESRLVRVKELFRENPDLLLGGE